MARKPLTISKVAELIGGKLDGDGSAEITGIAPIGQAGPAELTFAESAKRAADIVGCGAAAAIVGEQPESAEIPLIRVDNVKAAVARLLAAFAPPEDLPLAGIDPSAVVSPQAKIAEGAAIGPNVVVQPGAEIGPDSALCANVTVGRDVKIGSDCILFEGVVIRHGCVVGNRVRIGSNSVIGYDGFGYYTEGGAHNKIPHIGNVVLEDDVEIGACSCVDRGKFGSTTIGTGTKIDDLVMIAHNVQLGRGCLLAGQCGIAGSAKLGDYVVLGGHAGVRDNITLGNGVQGSAFAGVVWDIDDGEIVAGAPAIPVRERLRIIQAERKLPELLKRVKQLESRLSKLESTEDN